MRIMIRIRDVYSSIMWNSQNSVDSGLATLALSLAGRRHSSRSLLRPPPSAMLNLCAGAMLASVVAAVPAFHRGMAPEMMQDSSVSNDGSDLGGG
eukprot:COSAG02_NODE_1022_length_15153_cov_3.631460_11_plen_95_part_00